ncbi:MAG: SDR family oxidoreductase [Desulfuromonadales bacterium]|nr:SDR family oxidoreductase [Desulfuromonadales bacterium]
MSDVKKPKNDVLIVGCGDIGVRVAQLVRESGGQVSAVARAKSSAERLAGHGIMPVQADLDRAASLADLPIAGKLVFYLAPPPGGGAIDPRMRNFCKALGKEQAPAKVIYVSTSGVYGDCGGALIDEQTPVNPQTSRAKRRVDAENRLIEWGHNLGVPIVILRVTGIYGPGRLPIARIKQGHPVLAEADSPPTNRIHADDLAAVCLAAAEWAGDGEIFNVSDGQPGTMTQYFNAIADLLGLPRPQPVDMDEARKLMNPMMLSYLSEARRMDNRKMIEQLGVVLQYPDLAAGLKNVAAQLDAPDMGYLGSMSH